MAKVVREPHAIEVTHPTEKPHRILEFALHRNGFWPFLSHPSGTIRDMLTTTTEHQTVQSEFTSIDEMEQELVRLEGLVSRVRAHQLAILTEIDALQVPDWDGTRSLKEWIAGRLDIAARNAADLAVLAKAEPGPITDALKAGAMSIDRAAATQRLTNTGTDQNIINQADGLPVSQIGQLAARHHRMTPVDEATAHGMRRLWFQPNLGNTVATGSFTMTGTDMETLLQAVDTRADQVIDPNDENRPRLEQRRIDALVSLALDATTPANMTSSGSVAPRRMKAHIFIDAPLAAATNGEAGASIRSPCIAPSPPPSVVTP